MRTTNEIIIAIKEQEPVEYDELKMACLVLNTILFFNHSKFRRLLKGGYAADVTRKMDFPDSHADLGIPKEEWNALRMDPISYLGEDNIPGKPQYDQHYKLSKKLFEKCMKEERYHAETN